MSRKETLNIRIEGSLKEQFRVHCRQSGENESEVIRSLIRAHLKGSGDPSPQKKTPIKAKTRQAKSPRNKGLAEYRVGELYCGPGGMGIAASQAKVKHEGVTHVCRHLWATDYDSDSCKTYEQNVLRGSGEIILSDIHELDISRLEKIDGLHFGFPCNDYSIVGETQGLQGKFGPLYSYGVKVLDEHNPSWFFAENVGGLTSANEGEAFRRILQELSEAGKYGYTITANLYKFEQYKVPQARHRMIMIGMRNDLKLRFEVPKPLWPVVTARQAIEEPPILPDAFNNELTRQSSQVAERLRHIKPGQNAWNADLPEHLKLNVKTTRLSHIYKRLDPNKPSYTVTGSGGGGTHVYHWEEPRALTNRERARLQTFDDDFFFYGSKESVRKQIGMSIPPVGARIIIEAILKTMAGKPYQSIAPSIGYISEENPLSEANLKY